MAELAGAFAASHGPLIARDWESLPDGPKAGLDKAFAETGKRLKALKPDAVIIFRRTTG